MTKTYAITAAERELFEAVLNDSVDSIIQEAHDFEKMWCDPDGNVIETRKAKHQAHVDRVNKHQKAITLIESLPLITGEPVGIVVYKPKMLRVGALNREGLALPDGTKLYTHPQPLQPITADMVTGEIRKEFLSKDVLDEAIAAAVNTFFKHKGDTK